MGLPRHLAHCPLCAREFADVEHILTACPETRHLFDVWAATIERSSSELHTLRGETLRMELFDDRVSFIQNSPIHGQARILFVGRAMKKVAYATVTPVGQQL